MVTPIDSIVRATTAVTICDPSKWSVTLWPRAKTLRDPVTRGRGGRRGHAPRELSWPVTGYYTTCTRLKTSVTLWPNCDPGRSSDYWVYGSDHPLYIRIIPCKLIWSIRHVMLAPRPSVFSTGHEATPNWLLYIRVTRKAWVPRLGPLSMALAYRNPPGIYCACALGNDNELEKCGI